MSEPDEPTPDDSALDDQQSIEDVFEELPPSLENARRTARALGFSDQEADALLELTLHQLREAMARRSEGEPVTVLQLVDAIKQQAAEEAERERERERQAAQREADHFDAMCERELGGAASPDRGRTEAQQEWRSSRVADDDGAGYSSGWCEVADGGLEEYFGPGDGVQASMAARGTAGFAPKHQGIDIITDLCQRVELTVEPAKHLGPEDLVTLYSVSRSFHDSLDSHMLSSIRQILAYQAPEAAKTFQFRLYRRLLVPDPAGRTWEQQLGASIGTSRRTIKEDHAVRCVPGLRYLQLVLGRDRCCRDILAIMARHGHRAPPGTFNTLLRMWLLMDVSTSHQRRALLRNRELWTDVDLYNAQLFIVKLGMHFNDPIYGTLKFDIPILLLGQKGLYPLWQVLMRKRYTTPQEILEAKVRYDFEIPHDGDDDYDFSNVELYGVPFSEVGIGHMEGWGRGSRHLMRPDELVPYEAVVRGLELDEHLMHMMTWGHFDWRTGENLVPTEDEMYISDDEHSLAHADVSFLWQRKHAMKKRWAALTAEQRRAIIADDDDDGLRALAWGVDPSSYAESYLAEDAPPSLDDEIDRGFIMPVQSTGETGSFKPPTPLSGTTAAWAEFGTQALMTLPLELDGDELLRAEATHNYRHPSEDPAAEWDWAAWLEQERQEESGASTAQALDDFDMSASDVTDGDVYMTGIDDDYASVSEDDGDADDGYDDGDMDDVEMDLDDDDNSNLAQHDFGSAWDDADLERYIEDFFDHIVCDVNLGQGDHAP